MTAFVRTDLTVERDVEWLGPVARRATEREAQRSILAWLACALPPGSIAHHSPNETAGTRAHYAMRARDGVVSGWPDLTLCLPGGRVVFLETKRPGRGARLTNAQEAMHQRLRALGFTVAVVNSIETAALALKAAGVPLRHVRGAEVPPGGG